MPFEQLLAVLPAASKDLLPKCYQVGFRIKLHLSIAYWLSALFWSDSFLNIFACPLSYILTQNFRCMVKYFLLFLVHFKVSNKYKILHLLSNFRLGQLNDKCWIPVQPWNCFNTNLPLSLFVELVLNCLWFSLIPLLYFPSIWWLVKTLLL